MTYYTGTAYFLTPKQYVQISNVIQRIQKNKATMKKIIKTMKHKSLILSHTLSRNIETGQYSYYMEYNESPEQAESNYFHTGIFVPKISDESDIIVVWTISKW